MAGTARVLYRAGWQRIKVDLLGLLFLLGTGAVLTLEGPAGWILFLAGLLTLAGLGWYRQSYISRIEQHENGDVEFTVLGLLRPHAHRVSPRQILDARYHHGAHRGVNAPWTTIRLVGRRWPLLLDEQGTYLAPELVDRLLRRPPRRPAST